MLASRSQCMQVKGQSGPAKTIVFANSKDMASRHFMEDMASLGSTTVTRHRAVIECVSQSQRDRALRDLKSGRAHVLVATDVAARGRIGNKGVATSFVTSVEPALQDIVRSLQDARKEDKTASEVPGWLKAHGTHWDTSCNAGT
eukprot:Skav207753  [mRNA]  locus=scaffold181:114871:116284:- [translate_table: standard]